jgi:hypothetical protein
MHDHGHHTHSLRVVQETREHLEAVFGKGLVGLYDDKGEVDYKRLSMAKRSHRSHAGADLRPEAGMDGGVAVDH